MKKGWKIRVIKSDLKELRERVHFLTGNNWDISIGIDGVEGIGNEDGRMIINDLPKNWEVRSMLKWIKERKNARTLIKNEMGQEIEHLKFVENLINRQLESQEDTQSDS